MTSETWLATAFLVVSVVALVVQVRALVLIRRQPARPGLTRTAACRVAASVLYVAVGINAATAQWAVLQVAFGAFLLTQITWQVNALLDVRLGRPARDRGPRRIQITIVRPERRPRPR